MKNFVIYVHGKGGSAQEAEHYKPLFPEDEVIGFDYRSQTPWEAKKEFLAFFAELRNRCEHLTLVANSIGAYFALSSLDGTLVDRAYFISPIVDMEALIREMMRWSGVTEPELAEKREIATILNAALWRVAERFTEGFAKSLRDEGITNADVYLSQNDGTLMTVEHARRYPILTVACGPTNSIRGASYLSSLKDAIVVDVGGTTTDLGVIQNGFPRESSVAVTIGGVRTNFRMPDVISIGLGGGSIVRVREDGSVTVGPDSVGYEITRKALVFGGDVMTATDIAVRLGMVELGDASRAAAIPQEVAEKAMAVIRSLVEDSVDAMKVSNADADLILVGGGSIILPERISGAASVRKPEHFGCANAIGSAISKVSGTYEKLMNYDELPREQSLEAAKSEAIQLAVEAGAARETVEIIEMEDVPLAYYPGNTNRVKIKAAGDLR